MASQVLLTGPAGLGHHHDRIVRADIGLVEDEGFLFAGGPPVLHFLHDFVIESSLVEEFGLERCDFPLHHVALLLPAGLLLCEHVDLLVEVLHYAAQRIRVVTIVLEALTFLHIVHQ